MKNSILFFFLSTLLYSGECVVSISIGHTPGSYGSISSRGVPEYVFNRTAAKSLNRKLRNKYGIRSYLINPIGENVSHGDEVHESYTNNSHLLVSIHHSGVKSSLLEEWFFRGENFLYSDTFSGYGLFVSSRNIKFKSSLFVANTIGKSLRKSNFIPTLYHGMKRNGGGKRVYNRSFGVYQDNDTSTLSDSSSASVLIEFGIISNRDEELDLGDPQRRGVFIDAIALGIYSWCAGSGYLTSASPVKKKIDNKDFLKIVF